MTLTTEQLKNLTYSGGMVGDLARELLANREAQPVAWQETLFRAAKAFEALLETAGHFDKEVWADVPAQLRALTAPPAPAVPDERAAFNAWNNEDNLPIAGVPAKNAAWLAWQARAMLAQPVRGGYTLNSPEIPDGWVACSERMPDSDETNPIAIYTGKCLGQGMFVATYDEDGFFDYWEGGEIIGVTHWMPLPAAPGGGNG